MDGVERKRKGHKKEMDSCYIHILIPHKESKHVPQTWANQKLIH